MSVPPLSPAQIRARLAAHPARVADREAGLGLAAVALLLHAPAGAEPELLFIRRADRPDDHWSGHMAFPGGRLQHDDAGLEATARRETAEEIGVALGPALGRLDDYDARGGRRRFPLVVAAFVFEVDARPEVSLSHEVASVSWASLPALLDAGARTTHPLPGAAPSVRLPGVRIGDQVVWGMTLRILDAFFETIGVPVTR